MFTTELVIARYSEKQDCFSEISKNFTSTILYNKGNPINNIPYKQVNLSNVGREGHTYLHHIINNYDTLADYTLFTQAYPLDRGWNNNLSFFEKDVARLFVDVVPLRLLGIINTEHQEIFPPHVEHGYKELYIKKEWEELFKTSFPGSYTYSSGATIWVSKNLILSRSKTFYTDLLNKMNTEIHPLYGWVLERFWKYIFTLNNENTKHRT